MLVAAVVTLVVAVVTAMLGCWSLTRPQSDGSVGVVLRAVAPTQFAAAVMLAAGGAIALAAPIQTGILLLGLCVVGAVGTVAAGCYQTAKSVATRPAPVDSCAGSCASCTLSCH